MIVAIMQPYVFPYVGYFQLVSVVDKFIFYDDVNFINRGWINRNNILIDGKPSMFSIPLKNASQNRFINEIEMMDDLSWRIRFLKTTEHAYKKAPYFNQIFPLVSDVIMNNVKHIGQLASLSIRAVCDYLKLNTSFVHTSEQYNNSQLKAQLRILDICKVENASHYINPIGGMEIYSRALFESSGIQLSFIKTAEFEYHQFKNKFVPNLSIIDCLMFNDVEEMQRILKCYQLV